jgi:hypothetical protein
VLLDAGELLEKGPAGEDVLLNGAIDLLLFEPDGMTSEQMQEMTTAFNLPK